MAEYMVRIQWTKPGADSGIGTQIILEAENAEDAEAEAKTLNPMSLVHNQFQWSEGETVLLEEEITSEVYTDGE